MSMQYRVDLNCDMGEGIAADASIMPYVTSANIACGAHAGDASTMRATLLLAAQHHVAAGAHPGYPDRAGFGRQRMDMTAREVYDTVASQIDKLRGLARDADVPLMHVKPHGALYNDAATEQPVARAVVRAMYDVDPDLMLYGLAGSMLIHEAERLGVRAVPEAFVDRTYEQDGTLTSRGEEGAVIEDAAAAAAQAMRIVTARVVRCRNGSQISVRAETLCIHGDNARALLIARETRRVLKSAGVQVVAPSATP